MPQEVAIFEVGSQLNSIARAGLFPSIMKLLNENERPSTFLKIGDRFDVKSIEKLKWFFDLLDEKYEVQAVAKKSEEWWIGIGGLRKSGSKRVFFKIKLRNEKANGSEDRAKIPIHPCNENLLLLRLVFEEAFDEIDLYAKPFFFIGTKSSDMIDLSRTSGARDMQQWAKSCVLYSSLGGDSLLIARTGEVAWHQLETGEILPAGTFEGAISRYLRDVTKDREFCSWEDTRINE